MNFLPSEYLAPGILTYSENLSDSVHRAVHVFSEVYVKQFALHWDASEACRGEGLLF